MSFWQSKIKVRPADSIFSTYMRTKANWICEECKGDFSEDKQYLTLSHYHGRRKESVRFDEDNGDVLCRKCHQYFEEHKSEYTKWKVKKLGQRRYDLLTVRANTPQKQDDEIIKIYYKQKLKEIE